jgi:hypothetical protein
MDSGEAPAEQRSRFCQNYHGRLLPAIDGRARNTFAFDVTIANSAT